MYRGGNDADRGESDKLALKQKGFHYGMHEIQQI
jgi:hypothetical protein